MAIDPDYGEAEDRRRDRPERGRPTMPRVDYDTIAELYDEPIRDYAADPRLIGFLEARAGRGGPPARVLDVGCGTGKQIAANRQRWPGIVLVGVDRYAGMLRIARARCPRALWIQADAAALPLGETSIDYAISQFSYQHVGRTPVLLREVFRVLRPGGRFVMTNIDPWSSTGWLVYRFFPEALDLDRVDFLPVDSFVAEMQRAGFAGIEVSSADVSRPESLRAFLAYASQRHRASQFMALSDAAYAAGLDRVALALAAAGGDLVARSEVVLVTIAGNRPD